MVTMTSDVFGPAGSGLNWIYYTITKSQDAKRAREASENGKTVVLMFWADRNQPCMVMLKSFRDMAWAKKEEAVFCRVHVDKCKDIAEQYQVEALPTFLLIKHGEEMGRVIGTKAEELNTTIKANI